MALYGRERSTARLANPLGVFDLLRYVSATRSLEEMNRLYIEFDLKCWNQGKRVHLMACLEMDPARMSQ